MDILYDKDILKIYFDLVVSIFLVAIENGIKIAVNVKNITIIFPVLAPLKTSKFLFILEIPLSDSIVISRI